MLFLANVYLIRVVLNTIALPVSLIEEVISHLVRAYRNKILAQILGPKNVL